ncbi:MAG: hypothetical protein ABI912_02290 [Actinomycetota bacterium]
MNRHSGLDNAAVVLGAASVLSVVFAFAHGKFEFLRMHGGGIVVAVVLGVLACAAGWLANRMLALAAGAGFLLAALVLLVLIDQRGNGGFLDGNDSTFSLWLGLGVGLIVLGLTPRDPQDSTNGS